MAQMVLGAVGGAIGGPLGASVGAMLGGMVDSAAIAALEPPRQRGPRLAGLKVQGTAEGAPLPCVFGRARVAGQVIWAARFLESRRTSTGGKGVPRTVEYGYSLSFAVALCEGEIDGVGRIWADGQPMDLSGTAMRVHRGGPDQTPDPLIESIEGQAPAYRGTAYVVFEDLPLGPYGNRAPQLAFEVFRRPRSAEPRLEDRLEGVCLIPGAGEFVLATEPVMRREGLTRTRVENLHAGDGRPDLIVSLDQLQAQCPGLKRVSLVIGWFGTDLRAAECQVRPGVERRDKPTEPQAWSVAGLDRQAAHLISRSGGGPAYGGTPSDESVRQAVAELKSRGLEVTLYPFVFMDIAPGNALPDPYGGTEQASYPWRGRVRGRDGAEAPGDVAAMFGTAEGWGLRRLALHYARIASEAGVDGLLIGSEMRGLTLTRDADDGFPAVGGFRALAAECRAVAGPAVRLSYAADWSEYAGLREGGEVRFHLDPLWADPAIDYVAVDWYPPLGDWRSGDGGLDAAAYDGPDDPAYLAAQLAGGEGWAWWYACGEDAAAQVRTPIVDTAHSEDWVFRVKDIAGWWSNWHYDRPGGVRMGQPTAWVPGLKPVRLTEFGCAAVDRGGNAPNLFLDPKSAESALPPSSTGARDDRMQRRALEAVLAHFAANNPVSPVYGGPMLAAADAWCWDARPWPAFPGRADVWADASAWRTGHWLNGRLAGDADDLIAAILRRGGLTSDMFEVAGTPGGVSGYVIDRPMRTRDALAPLVQALGLTLSERGGRVTVRGEEASAISLASDGLALPDEGSGVRATRKLETPPAIVRVRFIDGDREYRTGAESVRNAGEGDGLDLDLPAVCSGATARRAAARALGVAGGETLTLHPGPLDALRLEAGDVVSVDLRAGDWRVTRMDLDETPSAVLEPVVRPLAERDDGSPAAPEPVATTGAPFFRLIEPPPLPGAEADHRPLAVVAADPWTAMQVLAGPAADALTMRGEVEEPAAVGRLTEPLAPGVRHRWDHANALFLRIEGRAPQSRSADAILAGANALLVEAGEGEWELVQFRWAELVGGDVWRLSGLLRGQQGTAAAGAPADALCVMLDAQPQRVDSPLAERDLPLVWRAGPLGLPAGGPRFGQAVWAARGAGARPWSPAHVRAAARMDGGFDLSWIARHRLDGDRWSGEPPLADPLRFRVRVLGVGGEMRLFEVAGTQALYPAAEVAADFPDGPDGARFAVSQWGEAWGWGLESEARPG
ncbi:glycoside hydrolase/phage tail family protein [Brevundimonas sp.]|uniref:baseplate multidomain protein megatron n=1 Tax=Brevundimonas sp. TaxID=1871086 RepID=UPI0035B0A816